MKLILNSFFICFLFICFPLASKEVFKTYVVKVGGIKIGKIEWWVKINQNNYTNKLTLKSEGLLSPIYRFEGEYYAEGIIKEKLLLPNKYSHDWKTKKIEKSMSLTFKNNKLLILKQKPIEKESLRINAYDVLGAKDPLSSFLQITQGATSSLVVDGRRLYKMNRSYKKKTNETTINLEDYFNLWADHKRRKFEKIIYEKKEGVLLPSKIFIYFDGRVFKIE